MSSSDFAGEGAAVCIARVAGRDPRREALLAPGRAPLSYTGLQELLGAVPAELETRALGPADRVALVIENGPEAATAFLSLSGITQCAPLNPSYRREELDFYLQDLEVRALAVSGQLDTPARDVARARNIDVIEIDVRPDAPAGTFELDGQRLPGGTAPTRDPGDCALLLHTSGTTSRPKLVPLTHGNLTASASNIASTLGLAPDDRCLNVLPLFHIHGLVAALLASLRAGGTVVCSPGFHPIHVFDWLREFNPTWFTAVPTMHQALLVRAADHLDVAGSNLRFIRSSSASLPTSVLERLEATFHVPVIEAYGMTEAAHQMASNPLPPARRKLGSVGPSAGPEIAILSAEGDVLPPNTVGEVAIRGANVFYGYAANPEANASAFAAGWFRTGDEGSLDADGYLFLHGRIKEQINRGGEKIAPVEIDERLLLHPAVAEAVTFSLPDPRLGEEVAAAVVLADGVTIEESELQDFVAQTLAPFKVPRRIVVLDAIPKGPTGKNQRIGLAERLGLTLESSAPALSEAPRNAFERSVAEIWASVLDLESVSIHDDFFALGGDSILAAEAVARMRERLGRPEIPIISIVRAPTVAGMISELDSGLSALTRSGPIELLNGGPSPPLFFASGGDGEVLHYVPLARSFSRPRPFYALRARGIDDEAEPFESVEEMGRFYIDGIKALQPTGPYVLGGFCLGATVAIEMARQLEHAGETVALLVLVDPRLPEPHDRRFRIWQASRQTSELWRRAVRLLRRRSLRAIARVLLRRPRLWRPQPDSAIEARLARIRDAYRPTPTRVPAVVILGSEHLQYGIPVWHIKRVVPNMRTIRVPLRHQDMLTLPGAAAVAREIEGAVDNIS